MSIIKTNNQYYSEIAKAIRTKLGVLTTYKPSEMANAILQLGINPYRIIVTSESGSSVTAVCNGDTKTGVYSNGVYIISGLYSGTWNVTVTKIGYSSGSASVTIVDNALQIEYPVSITIVVLEPYYLIQNGYYIDDNHTTNFTGNSYSDWNLGANPYYITFACQKGSNQTEASYTITFKDVPINDYSKLIATYYIWSSSGVKYPKVTVNGVSGTFLPTTDYSDNVLTLDLNNISGNSDVIISQSIYSTEKKNISDALHIYNMYLEP